MPSRIVVLLQAAIEDREEDEAGQAGQPPRQWASAQLGAMPLSTTSGTRSSNADSIACATAAATFLGLIAIDLEDELVVDS